MNTKEIIYYNMFVFGTIFYCYFSFQILTQVEQIFSTGWAQVGLILAFIIYLNILIILGTRLVKYYND